MSRTVTALYDSRSEAESACERLTSTVETWSPRIIDQNSESGSGSDSDTNSSMGSLYVSDEDRNAYGEGVRRGGFMLCAEVDSDADAEQIVQLLEQTSAVDMDQRQQDWSNDGWQPGASSMSGQSGQFGDSQSGSSDQSGLGSMRNSGTRQADRGGSSVRSYEWNSDSQNSSFQSGDQGGGMQSGQDGSSFGSGQQSGSLQSDRESSSFESDDQVSRDFQSDQDGGSSSR